MYVMYTNTVVKISLQASDIKHVRKNGRIFLQRNEEEKKKIAPKIKIQIDLCLMQAKHLRRWVKSAAELSKIDKSIKNVDTPAMMYRWEVFSLRAS